MPRCSVGFSSPRDDVSLRDDEETSDSKIDSRYLWSRLDLKHSSQLTSSTILTYTGSEKDKNQFTPDDDEDSKGFLDLSQNTKKYAVRTDFSYDFGDQLLEFGWQAEYAKSKYDSSAIIIREDFGEIPRRRRGHRLRHRHPPQRLGGGRLLVRRVRAWFRVGPAAWNSLGLSGL